MLNGIEQKLSRARAMIRESAITPHLNETYSVLGAYSLAKIKHKEIKVYHNDH